MGLQARVRDMQFKPFLHGPLILHRCLQDIISKRLQKVEIPILNPPRQGKKCLVLDIDYTFFDLGSAAERPDELARP